MQRSQWLGKLRPEHKDKIASLYNSGLRIDKIADAMNKLCKTPAEKKWMPWSVSKYVCGTLGLQPRKIHAGKKSSKYIKQYKPSVSSEQFIKKLEDTITSNLDPETKADFVLYIVGKYGANQ